MGDTVGYLRISKDRPVEGRPKGLGVERQREQCERLADSRGHSITRWFVDNDLSASKAVPRPQWDALLAGIRGGAISVVYTYDSDRLTRKPRENEDLIDLAESQGLTLGNVMGDVDLATANGRMIFRIKGAVARQEADRIGERVALQKEQRAGQGMPMGTRHRVFGYTRKTWELVPDEAAIVKDVFTRFLGGESKGSVTRDLTSRGVLTTAGKQWSIRATMRLLEYAPYAGLYVFKGEIIGKSKVPAIIDEATYVAAQTGKVRVSGQSTRKHLLSNILICDKCKAPMVGAASNSKGARYRCNIQAGGCGSVSIKAAGLEDMVNRYMSEMVVMDFVPPPVVDHQPEIDALDARIATLGGAEKSGDLDLGTFIRLLGEARRERAELVKAQGQTVTANAFDAITDYDALDISAKRARIRRRIQYMFVREVGYVRVNDEIIWTGGPKSFTPFRVYVLASDGTQHEGYLLDVLDYRNGIGNG